MTSTRIPESVSLGAGAPMARAPGSPAGASNDPPVEKGPFAAMLARDIQRPGPAKREEHPVASPIHASLVVGQLGLVAPLPPPPLVLPVATDALVPGEATDFDGPATELPGLDTSMALPGLEDPSALEPTVTQGQSVVHEPSSPLAGAPDEAMGQREAAPKPEKPETKSAAEAAPSTESSEKAAAPAANAPAPAQPSAAHRPGDASPGEPTPAAPATEKSATPSGTAHKDPAARFDAADVAAPGPSVPAVAPTPGSGELMAIPLSPVPTAKSMTPVTVPTSMASTDTDVGRARLLDVVASAVNQGIMQRAATGTVDVPGWGRIAVRAERVGASVDVRIASEDVGMHAILHGAQGALAADLRQAEIPLGHLRFEHAGARGGSDMGSPGDRGPATDESPSDSNPSERVADGAPEAPAASRVRIVL
jgi:hypothetical protein